MTRAPISALIAISVVDIDNEPRPAAVGPHRITQPKLAGVAAVAARR
jgi:hypothetical protein